jgi:TolB-like protein
VLFLVGTFAVEVAAQDSNEPTFVKFLKLEKSQPVAGVLGRENTTHIEVLALDDGQSSIFRKDEIKQIRKDISEEELIATVGIHSFLSWKIHKALPPAFPSGAIAKVDTTAIYVSLGSKAGVKAGQELRVYRGDTELKDPKTGAVLGTERKLVAKLNVFEVREDYCKGRLAGDLEVELKVGDLVEPTGSNNTLVIFPFIDVKGHETELGREVSEALTTSLVKRKVAVVERGQLGRVLGELAIQQSMLFDQKTAQQVGKQIGGYAALVGSLSQSNANTDLKIRLVEIETGRILLAVSHRIYGKAPGAVIAADKPQSNPVVAVAPATPAVTVPKVAKPTVPAATNVAPTQKTPASFQVHWNFNNSAEVAGSEGLSVNEVGKSAFDAGKHGQALRCKGRPCLIIEHSDKQDIWSSDFTIAFWLKVDDVSKDGIVMSKGQYNKPGWIIDIAANRKPGAIRFDTWNDGAATNQEVFTANGTLSNNTWHHVCVTAKTAGASREIRIYVDGKQRVQSAVRAGNLNIASMDLEVGKFNGNLDDLMIINAALDDIEVKRLAGD